MRYAFLVLGFLLFVSWFAAFVVFHIFAAAIHLLLILGFLFMVFYLFSPRRTV